jgi:hypothetical protein
MMQEIYMQRNRFERAFGKARQISRLGASYDNLNDMFLGPVRLMFGYSQIEDC